VARRALTLAGCMLAGVLASADVRADEPAHATAPITLAKAYGPAFPAMEDPPRDEHGAPTLVVQQGLGCVLVGTAGTAAALGASSLNVVQHIAGGLVAPANPAVLALGLAGVVFASYCSVGAALTPLYLYLTGNSPAESPSATPARTPQTPAVYRASLSSQTVRSGVLAGATGSRPR
jgi:hypothetical protein